MTDKALTEEDIRDNMTNMRRRAIVMFDSLIALQEVISQGAEVTPETRTIKYEIIEESDEVQEWLKDTNAGIKLAMSEEKGTEDFKDFEDLDLEEAFEGISFYVSSMLCQVIPHDILQTALQSHLRRSEPPQEIKEEVIKALGSLFSGALNREDDPSPFDEVAEIPEGRTMCITENRSAGSE